MCRHDRQVLRHGVIAQPHSEVSDITATGPASRRYRELLHVQMAVSQITREQTPAVRLDGGEILTSLVVRLILDADLGVRIGADHKDAVQDVLQPVVSVEELYGELV